ncbi:hypothetical protein Gotri_021034 [Gossypium trilobum]|uniref:RNase H type-1 domain-containing protein n=1 Tax=Gossypium trilobum TaxID=34281 RepID=A0A7J9DC13_9ROSI|nr:hypothetical protein [Gossypium trilobum]
MCFQWLAVKGDSLSVIKNIRKKEADKSILRPITYHIHQLDMLLDEVTYSFVSRAVNEAAHVLALEGLFGLGLEGLRFMQFCFEFGEGLLNFQLFSNSCFLLLLVFVANFQESFLADFEL